MVIWNRWGNRKHLEDVLCLPLPLGPVVLHLCCGEGRSGYPLHCTAPLLEQVMWPTKQDISFPDTAVWVFSHAFFMPAPRTVPPRWSFPWLSSSTSQEPASSLGKCHFNRTLDTFLALEPLSHQSLEVQFNRCLNTQQKRWKATYSKGHISVTKIP